MPGESAIGAAVALALAVEGDDGGAGIGLKVEEGQAAGERG